MGNNNCAAIPTGLSTRVSADIATTIPTDGFRFPTQTPGLQQLLFPRPWPGTSFSACAPSPRSAVSPVPPSGRSYNEILNDRGALSAGCVDHGVSGQMPFDVDCLSNVAGHRSLSRRSKAPNVLPNNEVRRMSLEAVTPLPFGTGCDAMPPAKVLPNNEVRQMSLAAVRPLPFGTGCDAIPPTKILDRNFVADILSAPSAGPGPTPLCGRASTPFSGDDEVGRRLSTGLEPLPFNAEISSDEVSSFVDNVIQIM